MWPVEFSYYQIELLIFTQFPFYLTQKSYVLKIWNLNNQKGNVAEFKGKQVAPASVCVCFMRAGCEVVWDAEQNHVWVPDGLLTYWETENNLAST